MNPERYQRICEVLGGVLERAPEDRANHLRVVCGGDDALREEVEKLLDGHEVAERDGFLNVPSFVIDAIPLELPDFGEYEEIEYIGHGGMGSVYRAHHKGLDCLVALKMSLPRQLTTAGDVARFRAEAQNMARLRHPNIVRVHEIEEYEGRPFFRMELVEGTSLDRQAERYAQDPKAAAELVAILARAVHHAHQRGVLHRDLKPQNVLLDEENTPYITDFGLARRLGRDLEIVDKDLHLSATSEPLDSGSSVYRGVVGTAGYISPEQADPACEETSLSDVYGLGAILYAVLGGRPPAHGRTLEETMRWVRNQEEGPAPLRTVNPDVDGDLEAVCLKCLEKDPDRRYGSAAELAEDLHRWRCGLQTRARRWNTMRRVFRWVRRQPVAAGLMAAVTVTVVLAGLVGMQSARHSRLLEQQEVQRTVRRQELLESTGHVARLVASVVRDRLDDLAETVEQESRRPELVTLLADGDRFGLSEHLSQVAERHPGAITRSLFESWAVFAPDGTMLAHSLDSDVVGTNFGFRDYFRGALEKDLAVGVPSAYVSRVYESRAQGIFKFGIACTIRGADPESRIVGLLLASVTSDRTMGLPQTVDSRYVPVLVAQRETPPEPEGSSHAREYVVLFHPAYEHGADPAPFPGSLADGLREVPLNDNYRDPLGDREPNYEGRWLAGLTPIQDTDFFVVVQVREETGHPLRG